MEQIQTPKKVKKISFSEYQVWKACQHKHYLSYRLRISDLTNEILVFGKSLHSALEKYAKGEYNRMLFKKKFRESLNEEINSSNNPNLKIDLDQFVTQADKIFKKLDFIKKFNDYEVVSVEEQLMEKLIDAENIDDIIFYKGFVDLFLKNKVTGRYLIVDWKSAMRPWNIEKKMEDKLFFAQLVLYRHFLSVKFNIDKNLIDTKFISLIRFGDKLVEDFKVNISDDFETFVMTDIKAAAIDIHSKTENFSKKRTTGKLTDLPCKYCSFKNTDKCTEADFQFVEIPETQKKD